jgi:hypothetical protein
MSHTLLSMSAPHDVWIPLVDEPIGAIVAEIQEADPEIGRLVDSPNRILAFKTFAYIRVGILLGRLLVEHDAPLDERFETWVEALLAKPEHREAVVAEVRAVAEEIAADPAYGPEEPIGPDEAARERFRELARSRLG